VVVLIAVTATAIVFVTARARFAQDERAFKAAQNFRGQRIEQRIDTYFGEAFELVNAGAHAVQPVRGNVALLESLTLSLLRAREDSNVYGVGVFWAPYAFDGKDRLFSIYDHVGAARPGPYDHVLPGGIDQVVTILDVAPAGEDYTLFRWYSYAVALGRDRAVVSGPYTEDGRSFISTLRPFYSSGGKLEGVVAVDTLTSEFKALMAAGAAPGDVAWIEKGHTGRDLVGTAPIPPGPRLDRGFSLRYTRAMLHLSTDERPLEVAARDETSAAIGLIVAIWIVAGIIAIGLLERWHSQERQRMLEADQQRLEDEIAFSRTVEAELRKVAFTDSLTGLPNRAAFLDFAAAIIAQSDGQYGVFFIDLDRFNIINETLGHIAGDELLRAVGARLQAIIESTDMVARLGGDEFVLVAAVESRSFSEAASLLLAHLSEPIIVRGRTIYPESSIGVVAVDDTYSTPEELLRDADIAMYEAKDRGRGQFAIFDSAMRRRVAQESQLEEDLRHAIERGEIFPYYQPIVSMKTREIVGFEALVRWHRADGTIVTASEFMDFAEERGFVEAIDSLVFRAVCGHAQTLFSIFPWAMVAINVSAAELTGHNLAQTMEPLMRQHGLPATRLKLEITETAMMTSSDVALRAIERLRALGLQFVLDDFGTGYSSLSYLQRLPISGIKIDRSFVQPLLTDPKAVEIVRSIVALARSFGLETTAEGVETSEHYELLASLGVDHGQGFFFSPAVEIEALVRLDRIAL